MTVMTVVTVEPVKTVKTVGRRAVGVVVVVTSKKGEVPLRSDKVTEGITMNAENEGHWGLVIMGNELINGLMKVGVVCMYMSVVCICASDVCVCE